MKREEQDVVPLLPAGGGLRALTVMLVLAAVPGCLDAEAEPLGTVASEIKAFGDILELATYPSTAHLSTAYVSSPTGSGPGGILSAFTVVEGTDGRRDTVGDAAYAFMPGPAWYTASTTPVGGQLWREWDDPVAPWPEPENLCGDAYVCPPGVDVSTRYVAAVSAFSTGYRGVGGVVAVLETRFDGQVYANYDVVVLSSLDGGRTLSQARIVSAGPSNRPSQLSGGHRRPYPDQIHASTLIRPEEGTERDKSFTAPLYVSWRGGQEGDFFGYWLAKVQVDPNTGHIDVLNDAQPLDGVVPDEAGTLTTQAWRRWEDGLDTVAFLWSERTDEEMGLVAEFEPCPTDRTYNVIWRYRRATGLFNSDDIGNPTSPTWATATTVIDEDERFRPCVGPSHSSSPSAPAMYISSDRANIAINRGWPWLSYITYTKTDLEPDRARVWLRKNGDPQNYFTPEYSQMPAPGLAEDYNPIVTVHQGNGLDGPQFVLARMRTQNEEVSVVGRSHFWSFTDLSFNPWTQEAPSTGVEVLGQFTIDEDDIAPGDVPDRYDGMTLGLTQLPVCVNDDYYGPCSAGAITPHPDLFFHAAWGRSASGSVEGRKFEHL